MAYNYDNSPSPSTSRYLKADVVKGMVIIAIVFIHVFINSQKITSNDIDTYPPIVEAMYTAMVIFFIISGFFYKPKYNTVEIIKKRLKQVLLPVSLCIVVLTFILFLWLMVLGHNPSFSEYINPNLYSLLGTNAFFLPVGDFVSGFPKSMEINVGYYYLQLMAVAFILFYPIAKTVYHDNKKIIGSIVLLLFLNLIIMQFAGYQYPFHLEIVPLAVAFMLSGMYLSKNELLQKLNWRKAWCWALLVASAVLLYVMVWCFPPTTYFNRSFLGFNGGFSVLTYFVIGMLASFVVYCIGSLMSKIMVISTAFAYAGRHTLCILLLSTFIVKMVTTFVYGPPVTRDTFPAMPAWVAAVLCIFAIVLCVVLAKNKDRILSLLCLKRENN